MYTYGEELFSKTITVTVIQLIELKGNKNYFELARGSSYRGFELPRVKLQ